MTEPTPSAATGRSESGSWEEGLVWGKSAAGVSTGLKPVVANALLILLHDPGWDGVLGYDEFSQGIVILKPPPYRDGPLVVPAGGLPWTDEDDIQATAWLNRQYRLFVGIEITHQAVIAASKARPFHPVRDYLVGVAWDGVPRLDGWLTTYLGVEDTPYSRAIARRWLISAIARVLRPGSKVDHVLILEGPQGLMKSTALRALAPAWFTDELDALGSKDAAIQLLGVWIVELAELDALGKSEVSRTKAFISKSFDRFRPPYARNAARFDRQCVFAGTVNHSEYLRDETGNRRYWPVACHPVTPQGTVDVVGLEGARDQLWAEAKVAFERGEPWWFDTRELTRLAESEQERRYQVDAWESEIEALVQGRPFVTIPELLKHLGVDIARQGQSEQNRAARSLKRLGWQRRQVRDGGVRRYRYFPPLASSVCDLSPEVDSSTGDAETRSASGLSSLSSVSPDTNRNSSVVDEGAVISRRTPPREVTETYGDAGDTEASDDGEWEDAEVFQIPCYSCRGMDFWTNDSGEPVCRRCHPPVKEMVS